MSTLETVRKTLYQPNMEKALAAVLPKTGTRLCDLPPSERRYDCCPECGGPLSADGYCHNHGRHE